MPNNRAYIDDITHQFRDVYVKRNALMTFQDYVDLVAQNPRKYVRNSAHYLLDAFAYFGTETVTSLFHPEEVRFKLFNIGTERSGPIIGGEQFQNEFYYILKNFARNGFNSLLTLFHGPNGSAKSSSVETIANAMESYSKTEEGAIYRFNWIFPTDKDTYPAYESGSIGFGTRNNDLGSKYSSFALLEEGKISAKLGSEFKENPLFLIPMPFRETLLKAWLSGVETPKDEAAIPPHLLSNGLSKKNQEIFEHLLNSYHGDLAKVFRHVQVERFYYSKQYRVGISTVEPQMSIDAFEKQVTLDKNYMNLPSILQAINFHQYLGPIVEANRGILEFSDLLKRPLETFKYLISAIEKNSINLPSGTAGLDIIFVATTNDKHLDAFKAIPDFSSFKGRFELVTVPYILVPEQEEHIFNRDIEAIKRAKPVCPHSLNLLCTWGVLTRIKQADPEKYPQKYRSLISRLDPFAKLMLYQNKMSLIPGYSRQELTLLKEVRDKIVAESQGTLIYEGRFGASPRELRAILHRAAHNAKYSDLTPMAIFEEIEGLIKDKSVYEFLQFEPRGHFHDVSYFIDKLKEQFTRTFENEVIQSMSMVGEREYSLLLERYVNHVVAHIKNEKIWDEVSHTHIPPSDKIMSDVENILQMTGSIGEHRNSLLSRIAAFRIENPTKDVVVSELFHDFLAAIKEHSYNEKRKVIDQNFKAMIALERGENVDEFNQSLALQTYKNMEDVFGYSRQSTYDCMRFAFKQKSSQKDF